MAVKRVFGTVDGNEVILDHVQGDIWQVPVPLDEDGEYVVEIIAEDEAGNQAYLAKLLFAVNAAQLCVHVIPIPFYGSLLACRSFRAEYQQGFYAEVLEPECSLGRR